MIARRGVAALLVMGVAALLLVVALVPSSAAKGKKKPSPFDLTITKIDVTQLPGQPPYIALNENSRAPAFKITVTVRNYGKAVGPTQLDLKLELNGSVIWSGVSTVGKLTYRDGEDHFWEIKHLKLDPGLLEVVAKADATDVVKNERNERNNLKTAPLIPVVPRDWKVDTFRTTINQGGGVTQTTQTMNGFYYHLSHFDESSKWFVYEAYGSVMATADFVGGGCAGHGSAQATERPWPGSDSELVIKSNLSGYSAGVDTHGEPPFQYSVSCGPAEFPQQAGYHNLVTWVGTHSFPAMKFDTTTLDGSGMANTPVGPADFTWHFVARLSGA